MTKFTPQAAKAFAKAQKDAIDRALKRPKTDHEKLMRQAQQETQGGGYQTGGNHE